jgi:hypothetical protein
MDNGVCQKKPNQATYARPCDNSSCGSQETPQYSDTFKAIAAFIAFPLERDLQLRLNRLKRNEDSEKWCHGLSSQGDSP